MFLPCLLVWKHLAYTQSPICEAFLCSQAKKQLGVVGFFLATKSWDPPKPTGALRSSDPRRICSAGLEAAVPAEVSQPPHALAPGPVPSFAGAQTHPCASVSHPVSVSSGQTIEFQGKIHPLLMCRGRSWHKQGCDQNYSPKVQP